MTTEKWTPGGVASFTTAIASGDVNALAAGSFIVSSQSTTNAVNLDEFADLGVNLGSITTGAGAPYLGVYLMPLNPDGSTFGNNLSGGAGMPPGEYWVGNIEAVPSRTGAVTGTLRGILLPPSAFRFAFYNGLGAALNSLSNAISYKTYDRALV